MGNAILIEGEIGFWFAHVPNWKPILGPLHDALQDEERRAAAKFRFVADRERFVLGRALLRLMLAGWLDCAPRAVAFQREAFGKPFVAGRRPEFNLSHSGDWILAAVSPNRRVGVDVEKISRRVMTEGLVARVLSAGERAEFQQCPETQKTAMFHAVWTRKEALVKAAGLGLRLPLREITVGAGCRDEGFRTVRNLEAVPGEWSLASLRPDPAYKAALAVEGVPPHRLVRWSPTPPDGGAISKIRF